jgi:MFS family permease
MRFFLAKEEAEPLSSTRKPRFFYGYIIVAVCFFVMMVMHGTYNTFGVFFTPLEDEFHSTRALLSGANSFAFLIMGLSSILAGILADKYGPKIVLTASALLFGAGYLLMSQAGAIWQAYLFFTLTGIGLSAPDIVPLSSVVRWFIKKRGMMSGIMKVGTGMGMMVMPLVASVLINNIGWSKSYLVLGTLVLVTVIPLAQFLRRDPHEMGLLPDGEKQPADKLFSSTEEGLSFRDAIRTRQLWMVCGFYFATVYCGMTILVHIVPYAEELVVSKTVAASIVSTIGGVSMLGRIAMGFTGDRVGHKRAVVTCFIIAVIALSWLQFANQLWMLYLFAIIYGFSHGGFYALTSPLIAGLFGTRLQGTLLGIVIFFGTLGGSIGMTLSGYIYDITDKYQLAFLILLIMMIIGLILTALIRPVSKGKTIEPAG